MIVRASCKHRWPDQDLRDTKERPFVDGVPRVVNSPALAYVIEPAAELVDALASGLCSYSR